MMYLNAFENNFYLDLILSFSALIAHIEKRNIDRTAAIKYTPL